MFRFLTRKPKVAATLTGHGENIVLFEDNTATYNGEPTTPADFWAAARIAEWRGLTLTEF